MERIKNREFDESLYYVILHFDDLDSAEYFMNVILKDKNPKDDWKGMLMKGNEIKNYVARKNMQIKVFSGSEDIIHQANKFMKNKNVKDVKFNATEKEYSILIIYEEEY